MRGEEERQEKNRALRVGSEKGERKQKGPKKKNLVEVRSDSGGCDTKWDAK